VASDAATPNGGRQAGFTLLEILVVLVVLGLLVVGLAQGVRTGLMLWGAQTRRMSEISELDAVARTVRTLLTEIPASSSDGAASATEIKGRQDSIEFVGDLPTGLGNTRRANITIELRGGRLVLRWIPRRHEISSAPPPQPTETELLGGVDHIDFAYWSTHAIGQPAAWQVQWERPEIPELIRLRLGFAHGDRRRWPDLIAAPQH
jgi:general secretion pathway protein J